MTPKTAAKCHDTPNYTDRFFKPSPSPLLTSVNNSCSCFLRIYVLSVCKKQNCSRVTVICTCKCVTMTLLSTEFQLISFIYHDAEGTSICIHYGENGCIMKRLILDTFTLYIVVETCPALSHLPVKLTELNTKIHLCHDRFTNVHNRG